MLLLVAFAIVAGAGTALTPCVLPVLPGLLSAAGTGGRRRPLGVIVGLAGTHTLAIVALATVIDGVGLPSGAVRTLSVVVLAGFGLLLLLPEAAARVEALLSRLVRVAPRSAGSGFWSGVVVGGGLGFVYAPCAGPILAAVVSVSATQGASGRLVAVALGYAAGSAVVLLAIAYGGRRVIDTLRRRGRGPAVQRSLGAVMLITAVAVGADLDVRFQTLLANHVPTFLTNPTHALERTGAVEDRLAGLRGRSRFDSASAGTAARTSKASSDGSSLPVLGHAPDFRDNERWFNTPGGRPLTLRALRGRVVLVDFWTYTCINCIRTLPALRAWDDRYRRAGLTIVGVHTPEFPFERDPRNVGDAIAQNRLRYPIAQDNAYGTWNAWGNQYWPAKYLIDGQGRVRYTHFGEGDYDVTERAIRSLLKEAGAHALGASADAHPEVPATGLATPETYLGTKRAQGWAGKPPTPGSGSYPVVTDLPDRAFALGGSWRVSGESATALHAARVDVDFTAQKVFLVLSSAGGRPRSVRVFLDGRPVPSSEAGEDVHGGALIVRQQRLYRLVSLPRSQRRRLTLRFGLGVSGFAFTFG